MKDINVNRSLSDIAKGYFKGLFIILNFIPVILALAVQFLKNNQLFMWFLLLSVSFLAGFCIKYYFTKLNKFFFFIIGAVVSIILQAFFTFPIYCMVFSAVFYTLFFNFSFGYPHESWEKAYSNILIWMSLVCYFIVYVLYLNVDSLKPYAGIIGIAAVLNIIASVYRFAYQNLKELNKSVRKLNLILAGTFIAAVLLIALINPLRIGGSYLLKKLLFGFFVLLGLLFNGGSNSGGEQAAKENTNNLFKKTAYTNTWVTYLLNTIFNVITIIIIAALLILLFYKISKNFKSFIKKIWGYITSKGEVEDKGYTDEKENLLNLDKILNNKSDKFKKWLTGLTKIKAVSFDKLSGKDKVRYTYKKGLSKFIKLKYQFKSYLTPSETLDDIKKTGKYNSENFDAVTEYYNSTRYGNKVPNENEINVMYKKINSDIKIKK